MGSSTYISPSFTPDAFDVPSDPENTPLGSPGDSNPPRDLPAFLDDAGAAITAIQVALNAFKATKAVANGLASLDSGGKVPTTQLPALAINDTFVVASQAAMLALNAQRGDVAVRTDLGGGGGHGKTFILTTDDPTNVANWQELLTPVDVVTSVDGLTGAVVLPADAAAGTASLRTLGAGATQAVGGTDARLSDARTPTAHAASHAPGGTDPLTQLVDIQTFTASGTWNKPTWAKRVDVYVLGGGAGGGSGRRGAAGAVRCGGGGGGGAGFSFATGLNAADLAVAVGVTVGAGGAGGAAQTVDSTDGIAGGAGGPSYFGDTSAGAIVRSGGSTGGGGGTAAAGTAGGAGSGTLTGGAGAAASTTGLLGAAPAAAGGATGGGSGAGVTSGDAVSAGGNGALTNTRAGTTASAGGAAGAAGSSSSAPAGNSPIPGNGAGGGGSSITGVGGNGGNGVLGSGGGGGGASLNGNNSGAGGNGGGGLVVIVSVG